MTLKVAPIEHKAAEFAVKNWHYSQTMPIGKLILFGVWENDKYIGAVMYGRGASPKLGSAFGLTQTESVSYTHLTLPTKRIV